MRILCVDFGDKKVGIAVSDLLGFTAQGIEVIRYESLKKLIEKICAILNEYKVEKIVIGFPKNMDGTVGFRGEKTKEFADKLKESVGDLPIILWDERLSTSLAKRTMIEIGVKKKNKAKVEDKIAAVFILQSYLDSVKR